MKKRLFERFGWKRVVVSLVLLPISIYLGILALAWFLPDKVLFRPQTASYKNDSGIIRLTTADGETIAAKFYENQAAKFTILFSHGNAEDIGTIEPFILNLYESGFSILVYDYHGYGRSSGTPSEENIYADIDAAYSYLIGDRNIPPQKIILHGRSLAGGAAVDLAVREPVGGLIMESTFTSASRVLTRVQMLPFDKFENITKLPRVNCPILVIHGKGDWTIPFHHAETLFAAAKEPKFSLWIEEAGHNNIFKIAGKTYLAAIKPFAETLSK